MPTAVPRPGHSFARRKPPHRIIIAHGENVRSITVRPWIAAVFAVVAVAFVGLYLAATGYLVFRDDLLAASLARQSRMQHTYEDRIAALRANIDRLTSRQLLNQQAVETEMERLLGRQAALDARQDIIAGLSQAMRRAGIQPAAADQAPADAAASEAANAERLKLKTSALTGPGQPPLGAIALRPATDPDAPVAGLAAIDDVEESLDELAREQIAFVDSVAAEVSRRSDAIAGALNRLGHALPPGRVAPQVDVGGPFVSPAEDADPEAFRSGVDLITGEVERFATIRRFASQLPLARPIANAVVTSRFGRRVDPFLGKPAMHTGVDFRAPMGAAARATAPGTVIAAEYSGGYGKMVEIDHGHGITTRFAHLSRINVKVGQVVAEGAVVGAAGRTGRSTGPHLHYEVRVDGGPIDPMRYLKAGSEIAPLL